MQTGNSASLRWPLAATLLLLLATLGASKVTAYRPAESLAAPLGTVPLEMAGFTGGDNPSLSTGVLAQLKPTSYLSRTYSRMGLTADVFIAYYAQQRAGESMHSPKHCLPGDGWDIWNYGSAFITTGGRTYKVNRYHISRDETRMLVLYWYQSRDRIIASEYLGKLLLARDALFQRGTAGAIVRIVVPDRAGSLEAAGEFAGELIPQVRRCFGG